MINLSIIIPVYNVARYIERCLRFVEAQTLHDIEVILVDDHGQDDSISNAKELTQKNVRKDSSSKSSLTFATLLNRGREFLPLGADHIQNAETLLILPIFVPFKRSIKLLKLLLLSAIGTMTATATAAVAKGIAIFAHVGK